jgi:hypothetical protein
MCSTSQAQAVAGMAVVLAQWLIFVEFVEFGWALWGPQGGFSAVFI